MYWGERQKNTVDDAVVGDDMIIAQKKWDRTDGDVGGRIVDMRGGGGEEETYEDMRKT